MLKKICPKCKQPIYSASEFALWLCPYCETNLRYVPAQVVTIGCFGCGGQMIRHEDRTFVCSECVWNMLGAIWTHENHPELIDLPFMKKKRIKQKLTRRNYYEKVYC